MIERGQSFGGPPGIPVTLHGSNGPQVRLKYDPDCTGRLLREGPEQSIIQWRNGNQDCVSNTWIERIGGEAGSPLAPAGPTTASPQAASPATGDRPPKVRKQPDALARRVSEFDDEEVQAFARANGCWDDKYLQLPNAGLRRMNILNRLRAKIKQGHEIKWN